MQPRQIVREDGWVHVDDLDPTVILYHRIQADEARYVSTALPDTLVVAVIDVKGGVKKTTAATHIAHGLHRHTGKAVSIGDSDQYHSVRDWVTTAQQRDPWPDDIRVVSVSGTNYHHELISHVREHKPGYLVVDTPPNDQAAALRALLLADVVIIPTGPFPLDIRRLRYALRLGGDAVKLRGRRIDVRAIITGTRMSTNIFKAARHHLKDEGLPFFNMPVRDLLVHAENFGTALRDLGDYEFIPDELVPLLETHREKASA